MSSGLSCGWSAGLRPRGIAQPKTIAKATYAKTLRKDDWPDQLA
jgi:hypothetical protein